MDTLLPGSEILARYMGAFVSIDVNGQPQEHMLVAIRGKWAIFEGESERALQMPLLDAVALISNTRLTDGLEA